MQSTLHTLHYGLKFHITLNYSKTQNFVLLYIEHACLKHFEHFIEM